MGGSKVKWKCATCHMDKTNKDHSVRCILCKEYSGIECTSYEKDIYDYLHSENIEINWICSPCKESLPELINLRENIKQQAEQQKKNNERITQCESALKSVLQKQKRIDERLKSLEDKESLTDLEERIKNLEEKDTTDLEERVNNLETIAVEDNNVKNLEERMTNIETKFSNDPNAASYADMTKFPPIDISENFKDVKSKQAETERMLRDNIKLQKEEKEEQERIDNKKNNLIVYGLPENKAIEAEQMLTDFKTVRDLYRDRVEIKENDIIDIKRLGKTTENRFRPLRIVFKDNELRNDVLKNNKYLKLEGDEHELCNCKFPSKHIHIYLTDDKTKKQQEADKSLREELKKRRNDGEENIIIRNGKIVSTSRRNKPRWIEIYDGQLY